MKYYLPKLMSYFPDFFEDEDLFFPKEHSGLSISEDKKNFYVEASFPGLEAEDIDMTIDKDILRISGERKEEKKEKKYYKKATKSFSYRTLLPSYVDIKRPEATYKNGILKITFKKIETKAKKINIKKG